MDKLNGFLLSYVKYGDYDTILHFYTKELGYQSFFLKGIYSAKNKKKAYLFPLQELSFTISKKTKSNDILTINKIDVAEDVLDSTDIKINSVIFFISDFLNQILRKESSNLILYNELKLLKQKVNNREIHYHYIFLIRILHQLGISPLFSESPFLNIEKAIFEREKNSYNIDKDLSDIWKLILRNTYPENLYIEKHQRKKLLDSIMLYYKVHFPEFYIPKSLPVILEILE